MLKFLASVLRGKSEGRPRAPLVSPQQEAIPDESAPIFESLAMTEELRDALFPKSPQMVSAIFDRPAPLGRRPAGSPPPAAAQSPPSPGQSFPFIF